LLLARLLHWDWSKAGSDDAKGAPNRRTPDANATQLCVLSRRERMRCILCKSLSDSSKSVEHIVPASLGNEDHVLPPGWVCDACNNYLSREVEAPFLNSEYGKRARFEMRIPSRRGRIPVVGAFHPQSRSEVNLLLDDDGLSVFAARDEDEARFINVLRTQTHGSLYVPVSGAPSPSYETARFISKIGL